jgi:hypothetical protein
LLIPELTCDLTKRIRLSCLMSDRFNRNLQQSLTGSPFGFEKHLSATMLGQT